MHTRGFSSWFATLLGGAMLVGCSSGSGSGGIGGATASSSTSSGTGGSDAGLPDMCAGGVVGFGRPATVRTFASYHCATPAPLVMLLHDYGSTGADEETYLGLDAQADAQGFLYVHPDGTKDAGGKQFWNATDACCNADGSKVNDVAYLTGLIWDIRAQYNVDPKRVYVIGHGNGGFMAYRMACDDTAQITAVGSLGGATWADATRCVAKAPLSVVEIHGTADTTFAYTGGTNLGNAYPSAQTTAADWAKVDKCQGGPDTSKPPLDLDSSLPGPETTVTHYGPCATGTSIDLWSITGGTHAPQLSTTFASTLLGSLLAHTKP